MVELPVQHKTNNVMLRIYKSPYPTQCLVIARFLCLAITLAWLLPLRPTAALTINLTFDSDASDYPTFDPTAALLAPIVRAAADHWEDIIHDTGTLEINYYYDDLSGSTLATHNNLATSEGKPTEAKIRFDTVKNSSERKWYFDPTPTNHSEYDLEQTLYRDLHASKQTGWFNGSPPDLLEVGYRGNVSATAPDAAIGAYDIFSTAIHEIGHAVGLTGNVSSGEYADGDYDVASNLVGGAVMAIEGDAHIDPRVALMCSGCGNEELRRMPTATDVFAVATGAGWTNLDLFRQDMWSAGDMNDAFLWEGNKIPGSQDDAFVRHEHTGTMTDDLHFQNITIAEGSWVKTSTHTIEIDNDTVLRRNSSETTQLFVDTGGTLMTEDLRLFGAELDMSGGTVLISDYFEIQPDDEDTTSWNGLITGNGIIDVADQLENDGIIRPDGGALTFRSVSTDAWDLDGDGGTGELDASDGDVIFDSGGLRDEHDGQIIIGDGHFVRFDFDWELGSGGDMHLNGTSLATAELLGPGTATFSGDITATGKSLLDTDLVFHSTADVSLTDADTELKLGKQTTDLIIYNGGNFTGHGELEQNGNATVVGGSTVNISVSTFDFDGSSASNTTIETGATLNVTSDMLHDSYSSDLIVRGTLNMDLVTSSSWSLKGSLVVNEGGEINGNELILTGALSTAVGGAGTINAPLDIHSSASLEITAAGDTLDLAGLTTWRGPANVTGFGHIIQNGDAHFTDDTTIAVSTYNMDGINLSTITIDPHVTVTLDVQAIDTGTDGFDGTLNLNSSTIAVNTTDAWSMEGTTNMDTAADVARISGSQIVIVDTLNTTGEGIAHIDADAVIESDANLTVVNNTTLKINGTTSLKGGSFNTGPATNSESLSRVELDGLTHYDGGTITVSGVLRQNGDASVNSDITINGDYFDMDGSTGEMSHWNLNKDLTLNVLGIEDRTTNNLFHGTIDLNNSDSTLTVNTATPWTMDGTLQISTSTIMTLPSVAGQNFILSGEANIDGGTRFDAIVEITGTVNLLTATSRLAVSGGNLTDINTIHGGTITGPTDSSLRAITGHSLVGYGNINTGVDFLSGSALLADDGTLTIDGSFIALGKIGTHDADGLLNIVNAWDTNIADRLELNGGSVTGALITNGGQTVGQGDITTDGFDNVGTLSAEGGTLTLNTTAIPDLDGTANAGVINAVSGNVHVATAGGSSKFLGTLNINRGYEFRMTSHGLDSRGSINMNGGTLAVANLQQSGQLLIKAGAVSTIRSPDAHFTVSGNNLIDDELRVEGVAEIHAGATLKGLGHLVASNGSEIRLQNGTTVDINVLNHGNIEIGSPFGMTKLISYEQTSHGQWKVDLGGTLPTTEHDVMSVSETAVVDGLLALQPVALYADPAVRGMSDEFAILEADSLSGNFTTVEYGGVPLSSTFLETDGSFRSHQGIGLFRNITYSADAVIFENLLANKGDTDGDRDVDTVDLTQMIMNFTGATGSGGTWLTGDTDDDDDVDTVDLTAAIMNYTGVLNTAVTVVPEPSCLFLLVMAIGCLSVTRAKSCRH